jgi:hypothetical protein
LDILVVSVTPKAASIQEANGIVVLDNKESGHNADLRVHHLPHRMIALP